MNLSGEASPQSTDKKPVEVRETRCTCAACGNVWYYGKEEVQKNSAAKMHQVGKAMMCCGGCFPVDKCSKCGSKAVRKEIVTHHV